VTAKGREWALQKTSPKNALEQLVAALQGWNGAGGADRGEMSVLQAQLGDLQASLGRISQLTRETVERQQREAERLTETVREAIGVARRLIDATPEPAPTAAQPAAPAGLDSDLLSFVRAWQRDRGTGCPLPDLYAHLRGRSPELTIGRFHDCLRGLHDSHELRLSGMSGSLDALRDPEMALLVSSKVMYYANIPDRPA
jgi:hypothetical protein